MEKGWRETGRQMKSYVKMEPFGLMCEAPHTYLTDKLLPWASVAKDSDRNRTEEASRKTEDRSVNLQVEPKGATKRLKK